VLVKERGREEESEVVFYEGEGWERC